MITPHGSFTLLIEPLDYEEALVQLMEQMPIHGVTQDTSTSALPSTPSPASCQVLVGQSSLSADLQRHNSKEDLPYDVLRQLYEQEWAMRVEESARRIQAEETIQQL